MGETTGGLIIDSACGRSEQFTFGLWHRIHLATVQKFVILFVNRTGLKYALFFFHNIDAFECVATLTNAHKSGIIDSMKKKHTSQNYAHTHWLEFWLVIAGLLMVLCTNTVGALCLLVI